MFPKIPVLADFDLSCNLQFSTSAVFYCCSFLLLQFSTSTKIYTSAVFPKDLTSICEDCMFSCLPSMIPEIQDSVVCLKNEISP